MIEYIIKRDGREEPFSSEKFNKLTKWSSDITSDGEADVDWSELALDAVKRLYNGCTTDEILQALINACLDKDKEAYFYIAGKLLMSSIYKNLYDDVIPPSLEEHLEDMEDKGIYLNFLDYYTEEDIIYLGSILNHSKDFTLTHSQVNQMRNKYLCTNKITKELYETPQFMFMRVALAVCMYDDEEVRLDNVKEVYTYLSNFHLNLPTPMWTNLGTPHKTGTSCFPANAKVDLETVRKAISDVKVGDIVLTHEGNYQKVTHVLPKEYEGKFVTLNTVAGYTDEFNCTFNHLIYAIKQRPSHDLKSNPSLYKPEWVQADNLRVGDYIKLGVNEAIEDFDYSVWDIVKNSQYLEEGYSLQENDIVFLTSKDTQHKLKDIIKNISLNSEGIFRLFGYYLAEGCVSKPSRDNGSTLLFTVGTKEQYIINDIISILESFGCTVGVYSNPSDNSTKISTHSKVLIALFLELFGTGFNNKRLCSKVLKAPLNLQQELLVGLIRGDGSAVISGYQVTLANEELIYQLRYICLRNKLHFAVNKTKKLPVYGNHYATIRIMMTAKDPLALKINKDLQKIRETKTHSGQNIMYREDGCFAKVRLISSYESSETVYDLTVENDHSFIVNGLSAHNCLVYTIKDSVGSLTAGDHISNIMTVAGAGIGNTIFTRSKKDPIQNGRLEHLGKIPYFRLLQANIQATMQSGARRGAATTYINCLDPEIRTLIHLRNPTSIEEERVDDIDYAFTFNSIFASKVKKNEDWMLISYQVAPDLWESMYEKNDQLFEQLFDKYFNDDSVQKTIIKARDLAIEFLSEQRETGRLYEYNSSNSNCHTPFKEKIYGSNLCIAGDQLVPSNHGLLTAQELNELNVNLTLVDGQKLVKSSPMQLRESYQDVYKITLKNGMSHKVTSYHKIMTDKGLVKCEDLVPGTHKAKINVSEGIFGTREMEDEAWLLGLWQGDGTSSEGYIHIDIWEDKTEILKDEIIEVYSKVRTKYTDNEYELLNQAGEVVGKRPYGPVQLNKTTQVGAKAKWRLSSTVLKKHLNFEKNVIPRWIREGNRETQIAYIKGLFQTDGTYSYSKDAHYLAIAQVDKEFLEQLQILLNNLGYVFSLSIQVESSKRLLPDSNRNLVEYDCKTAYRLVAGSFYTCLKFEEDTGFISFRGKTLPEPLKSVYKPKEYVKIISVEYAGKEDVYCPTVDSEEHLFVSHCFITRNCNEIYLSTKPFNSVLELYKTEYEEGDGYLQTCNLCAINLNKNYTDEEYYDLAYWALRIIDYVIDHSEYKLPQIGVTTKKFRSAGVSFMNLAAHMAKNKQFYNTIEGLQFIHELSERHEYMLMKASLQLSKEYGLAEWIDKTRYPEGWLPLDTYNKNVDKIVEPVYKYDWESLRKDIIANGGIHNCVLSTSVPGESCLVHNTKVQTSDGVLKLSQILEEYAEVTLEEADKVMDRFSGGVWFDLKKPLKALTSDASYKNISRVWYNGSTPLFSITMEDGSVIKATANHKFLVKTKEEPTWVRAADLTVDMEILEVADG